MHEPLLRGVTDIAEYFAGRGNLVIPMRERGITVHASDVFDRGCPNSSVRDFFQIDKPADACRVLMSNPPFARAMDAIEHAFAIGFEVVIFLLKLGFLSTAERSRRLHQPGHLRRVHVLAERLQGMHDANHLAKGGKKAGQPDLHAWFVLDRNYVGPATIIAVSINKPTMRMPWLPRHGATS